MKRSLHLFLLCASWVFTGHAQAQAQPAKLSPYLRMLASGEPARVEAARGVLMVKPAGSQRPEPSVNAFIRFQGDGDSLRAQFASLGATIVTVVGNLATAEVPIKALEQAANLPNVVQIEESRQAKLQSDVSVPATGANQVWYGAVGPVDHTNAKRGAMPPPWQGNTGEEALVGIIDTGIDLTHKDFMDLSGNTRILSLWDQTASKGTPPAAVTLPQNYPAFNAKGNECTRAQINAMRQKFDLAVTNYADNTMSFVPGNGTGGLGAASSFPKGHLSVAVAAGDFDRDGNMDLVTGNLDGTITWVQGNGSGGFTPQAPITVVNNSQVQISFVTVADLNDDGFPDVVAVLSNASAVAVMYGNGDGTFNPPGVLPKGNPANSYFLPAGNGPSSAAVADLNGDGIPDIVVTNYYDSNVNVFLGTASGQFVNPPGQPYPVSTTASNYPSGMFPSYVAIGDFNGDGVPDLAIANWGRDGLAPGADVSILLGNGDGSFQAPVSIDTGHFALAVAVGDFNGDGKTDIAVESYSFAITILLGNGDGTFGNPTDYDSGGTVGLYTGQETLVVGDFNQDGKPDVAYLAYSIANQGTNNSAEDYNSVGILLGNGDGTFGTATLYPSGSTGNSTSLANGNFHSLVCSEVDTVGHGTNVAGIAAGNGSAGGAGMNQAPYRYMGMAPNSGLVIVKTTFDEADIVNGAAYIESKANTAGLPVAINMSFGEEIGPHDGTSSFETMLSGLTGPGNILVSATGNDGNGGLHVDGTVATGHITNVGFFVGGGINTATTLDLWYPGQDHIGVDILDPNGNDCMGGAVYAPNGGAAFTSSCGAGSLTVYPVDIVNGDNEVQILIRPQGQTPLPVGNWTIVLDAIGCGMDVCVTKGTFDIWAVNPCAPQPSCVNFNPSTDSANAYTVDPARSINVPATASDLIAVGSYVTKTQWIGWGPATNPLTQDTAGTLAALSGFSGLGPRRTCSNGACPPVQKPDLAAPGEMIITSYSAGTPTACGAKGSCLDPDAFHLATQGTSLAAPHVTGAVALMLAEHSLMTPCQVKASLWNARPDPNTGAVPNNNWGYGKLAIDLAIAVPPAVYNIPNVAGLTLAAAQSAIAAANLQVGAVIYALDGSVQAGRIISQTPPAGTGCGAVNLLVSGIEVPDVTGKTRAAATTAITGANLAVGTQSATESGLPAGQVIESAPAAGTLVGPGTAVNLFYSGIVVPNVVGQTSAAAQNAIAGAQLAVGTITQQSSQNVPAGSVISEDPAALTLVIPGTPVNLVISGITVPNVVGQTQASGETAITGANLTVGNVSLASSETAAPGTILSENPAAGTLLNSGAAVAIVVVGVAVPNEAGQSVVTAEAAITAAQLTVGNISQVANNAPAGSVIGQNPAAGTVVSVGTSIDLTVSGGPSGQIKVPNVVGATQAAATAAIQNAGLTVGTVTVAVSGTVAAGSVIGETPAAGTVVNAGSAVNLVVSAGSAPQSITVTPSNPSAVAGFAEQFAATGIFAGNVTQNLTALVTWNSGTTSVATVSGGGLATTLKPGTSTIGATLGTVSGSTLLTVTAPGVCDINGDGLQTVSDVQSAVNQALGLSPSNGGANIANVQIVVNATLNLGCAAQ